MDVTQTMRWEMRLFGAHRGRTMTINGHDFVDGMCVLHGAPATIGHTLKYLASYQAYARGSREYDEALRREEAADGRRSDPDAGGERDPADEVPSDVEPAGEAPPAQGADVRGGAGDAEVGDPGIGPEGYGHADPGLPEEPAGDDVDPMLVAALTELDPDDDTQWTRDGLPKVDAVAGTYGADVTRADIEQAWPGFDREEGRAAREG